MSVVELESREIQLEAPTGGLWSDARLRRLPRDAGQGKAGPSGRRPALVGRTSRDDDGGARNAGILAAQMIALVDDNIAKKMTDHKHKLAAGVEEKSRKLKAELSR